MQLLHIELGGDVSRIKEELMRLKGDQSYSRQVIKELEEKMKNLESEYKSLQDIVRDTGADPQSQLKSWTPDKPLTFIGRDTQAKQMIFFLIKNNCRIVSIVDGPGFGKIQAHDLSNNHDFIVFFSYLQNISTVSEVIPRLCQDVGVNPGEIPSWIVVDVVFEKY